MSSENILRLNQLLDAGGYKASIRTKRDAVYIRGTFFDVDGIKKRKEIALNAKIFDFSTCRDRINDFYMQYTKKGHLPKEFSWNTKPEVKEIKKNTIRYAKEKFKSDYWQSKGNPDELYKKTEWVRTLDSYMIHLNKLDQYSDLEITPDLLKTVIELKSKPDSKVRQDMCKIYKRLGKLYFIDTDLKEIDKIKGTYKPNVRKRLDEELAINFIDKVRDDKNFGWLTAALFIYGVRPMEAFSLVIKKDGIATAVNCPKANKAKEIKYPIALGIEKDNYDPEPLIKRWDMYNMERIYSWDLENNPYDSKIAMRKIEYWTKWLKKNGLTQFGLVDLRHYWGIRSIYADIDTRQSCKSLGHSYAVHTSTYNSTYSEIDAIKTQKRLSKT